MRLHPDGPGELELDRLAVVAALTDAELIHLYQGPTTHSEMLDTKDFAGFAAVVWACERRAERLLVAVVEELDAAVAAAFSGVDANGRWQAGTPVLYVKAAHRRRLVALHEIAHLTVDEQGVTRGHSQEWLNAYVRLQRIYLPPTVSDEWVARRSARMSLIAPRVAADPNFVPSAVLEVPGLADH